MIKLKEQALLERIGQLTVAYEDKVADLRVELTHVSQQNEDLKRQLEESRKPDSTSSSDSPVLEGNIV